MKISMKKNSIIPALIYGQLYALTGSMFTTIIYRLFEFYDELTTCYITEVFFYIMQAIGTALYDIFIRRNDQALKKLPLGIMILVPSLFGIPAIISDNGIMIIVLGGMMNLFIGAHICAFLTRFTTDMPFEDRGKAFGIAYAIGSIGTYLISLPSGGSALTQGYIIYVYMALTAVSILLVTLLLKDTAIVPIEKDQNGNPPPLKLDKSDLTVLLLIFMIYVINSVGLHFKPPSSDSINIVFSRAFYSIGLIVAGFITDKSRKAGAISAFIALGFWLISPALMQSAGITTFTILLGYIFLGFTGMYRMICFSDQAEKDKKKQSIATFGFVGMLLGQAVGTSIGEILINKQLILICVTMLMYIFYGAVFFIVMPFLYPDKKNDLGTLPFEDRKALAFEKYVQKYGFNAKQSDVLKLLLEGDSNCEIAEKLFLAESTVKYHVKNILKVTGFSNRGDLIEDYKKDTF
ncbi:MAG: hypothetical protein J6Y89_11245 [Lachnospiraceae bacterium]|nr:hypothetical protein [Lachnospiraceae bacterium]